MNQGINVVGLYVGDQGTALTLCIDKLGFRVHTDVHSGPYRWLTVQRPEQPSFQLGLFQFGSLIHDETMVQTLRAMMTRGAMPPLVLTVTDYRATYAQLREHGIEFTQEPIDRLGNVDAGLRDPAGNGWKIIQAAGGTQ